MMETDTNKWEKILKAYMHDTIVQAEVTGKESIGLSVTIDGTKCYLPKSQNIQAKFIDQTDMVGSTINVKIKKIDIARASIIVSTKDAEEEIIKRKADFLTVGETYDGIIKNISSYGFFVTIADGVDGLVHVKEISWSVINIKDTSYHVGDKIKVKIIGIEDNRYSLSIKALLPDPWIDIETVYKVGEVVKGKIKQVRDFGAIVGLQNGIDALLHVSEISWSSDNIKPHDKYVIGEEIDCVIININKDERKIGVSVKQLTADPWDDIESKYPKNSSHNGKVTSIPKFGLFVKIDNLVNGLVHYSDIIWLNKRMDFSTVYSVGDEIEVVIKGYDKEKKRISLLTTY